MRTYAHTHTPKSWAVSTWRLSCCLRECLLFRVQLWKAILSGTWVWPSTAKGSALAQSGSAPLPLCPATRYTQPSPFQVLFPDSCPDRALSGDACLGQQKEQNKGNKRSKENTSAFEKDLPCQESASSMLGKRNGIGISPEFKFCVSRIYADWP